MICLIELYNVVETKISREYTSSILGQKSLYLQTLYSHIPLRHNVGDCSTYYPHHWNLTARVNGNYVIEDLWISLVSLKHWGVARHEAGRLALYTGSWWLQSPTTRPNKQHPYGDVGHVSLNKLFEQKLIPDKETRCFFERYFVSDIQGVTGGTDQTSGERSLGHTIPI